VIPGAVSPKLAGYADIRGYRYDPKYAKELLAKAGYPDGFEITMWGTPGAIPKVVPLYETIQKYFAAVGVKAKIELMEWSAMKWACRLPKEKNKSMISLQKWGPSTAEATWMFDSIATTHKVPPAGGNRAFYSNPIFDELLDIAMSSPDVKKRDAYLRAAQIIFNEDAPFVFLITPEAFWGKSKKVHDFVFSPISQSWPSEKTWIEK
jgi:ABC-type transport system substrate-binding protein